MIRNAQTDYIFRIFSVSSAVKKSKQIHKRNLRNSTLIQSPGSELSENGDDINEEQLNCNGLNHLKHNRKLQNGRMSRNLSPLSDTTPTKHQKRTCQNLAKSTDVDKNLSTKNDKCAFARQRVQSDDAKSFAKHENSRDLINPDIYFSLNGVDNEKVVDDIMEEITDIQVSEYSPQAYLISNKTHSFTAIICFYYLLNRRLRTRYELSLVGSYNLQV